MNSFDEELNKMGCMLPIWVFFGTILFLIGVFLLTKLLVWIF